MVTIRADVSGAGTGAALGRAGGKSVVVDRPEGRAGGLGLGFNGGELLALALGGCFSNDVRYAAERLSVPIGDVRVQVTLELDGEPLRVIRADVSAECETLDGSDPRLVLDAAQAVCTVARTLEQGASVAFTFPSAQPASG